MNKKLLIQTWANSSQQCFVFSFYQPEKAMGLLTYIEKNILNGKISAEPARDDGKEGSPSSETSWENWRPMLSVVRY